MREGGCRTQHLPAVSSGSVRDRRCASRHTSISLTFFLRPSPSLLAPLPSFSSLMSHMYPSHPPLPLHFPSSCRHTCISSPLYLTHFFRSVLTITSLPSLITPTVRHPLSSFKLLSHHTFSNSSSPFQIHPSFSFPRLEFAFLASVYLSFPSLLPRVLAVSLPTTLNFSFVPSTSFILSFLSSCFSRS